MDASTTAPPPVLSTADSMSPTTSESAAAAVAAPAAVLRIAVGSTNPAKIRAVRQAFKRCCTSELPLDIQGYSVESEVPDQPFGDAETCQGSKNRAAAAFKAYIASTGVTPHFGIGMEGGLEWSTAASASSCIHTTADAAAADANKTDETKDRILLCMAWMSVYGRRQAFTVDALASLDAVNYRGDRKPVFGVAKTAAFSIPQSVSDLVEHQGLELGDADDQIFGRTNGGNGTGTVGLLSKGLIDRSAYYEHAIILALMPWIRPDIYLNGTN